MPSEFLTTLSCRQTLKTKDLVELSKNQRTIEANFRTANNMKFQLDQAAVKWSCIHKEREKIERTVTKVENNLPPTDGEINDMETEMNRERKFNTVSKLKG